MAAFQKNLIFKRRDAGRETPTAAIHRKISNEFYVFSPSKANSWPIFFALGSRLFIARFRDDKKEIARCKFSSKDHLGLLHPNSFSTKIKICRTKIKRASIVSRRCRSKRRSFRNQLKLIQLYTVHTWRQRAIRNHYRIDSIFQLQRIQSQHAFPARQQEIHKADFHCFAKGTNWFDGITSDQNVRHCVPNKRNYEDCLSINNTVRLAAKPGKRVLVLPKDFIRTDLTREL